MKCGLQLWALPPGATGVMNQSSTDTSWLWPAAFDWGRPCPLGRGLGSTPVLLVTNPAGGQGWEGCSHPPWWEHQHVHAAHAHDRQEQQWGEPCSPARGGGGDDDGHGWQLPPGAFGSISSIMRSPGLQRAVPVLMTKLCWAVPSVETPWSTTHRKHGHSPL